MGCEIDCQLATTVDAEVATCQKTRRAPAAPVSSLVASVILQRALRTKDGPKDQEPEDQGL